MELGDQVIITSGHTWKTDYGHDHASCAPRVIVEKLFVQVDTARIYTSISLLIEIHEGVTAQMQQFPAMWTDEP